MNELLQRAGGALYGPRWQADLAGALGVSDRTLRRWVAGEPVPAGVYADLTKLVRARLTELREVAELAAQASSLQGG